MLIDVKGLSAYYRNNKVFSDVSFNVFKDDYLCITGENGSGKTTLMNMISGIYYPDEGHIFINDDGIVTIETDIQKIIEKF